MFFYYVKSLKQQNSGKHFKNIQSKLAVYFTISRSKPILLISSNKIASSLLYIEWIDIANTEYRYTTIRIPVNTGIPVFLPVFFKPNLTADRRKKSSSFDKILM
jgi:hypothetical protein